MQKNKEEKEAPILPDLKHDTMEFAASTDGDDQLDIAEDEEITADELEAIDQQDEDEANALEAASIDSEGDEDNFLSQQAEPDEFEEDAEDNPII